MTEERTDRVGMLILRLWIEGHEPTAIRARVTQTLDAHEKEHLVETVASVDEIYAEVRRWVEEFIKNDGSVTPR